MTARTERDARPFEWTEFVLIRTAGLPFSRLAEWAATQKETSELGEPGPFLRELFSSPRGRLALRLASPSIHLRLSQWLAGKSLDRKVAARLHRALVQYFLRWSTRATPFGLFAAVDIVAAGSGAEQTSERFFVQADQSLVEALWTAKTPACGDTFGNPTVHRWGNRTYFFVRELDTGGYSLRSIDTTASDSEDGREEPEVMETDGSLLRRRAPRAVGPTPLTQWLERTSTPQESSSPALSEDNLTILRRAEGLYGDLDSLRTIVDRLDAIGRGLRPHQPDRPGANVTTLGSPEPVNRIPELQEILHGHLAGLLQILWRPTTSEADEIHRLLVEHHGAESVSLLEFASQTLWPVHHRRSRSSRVGEISVPDTQVHDRGDRFDRWTAERLATHAPDHELCLTEEDVLAFSDLEGVAINQSGYVLCSPVRVDGRERLQVKHVVGPSALSILGRFATASPDLLRRARQLASREQDLSAGVIADLSLVHGFGALNVLCRPSLREAEICLDRPPATELGRPHRLDLSRLHLFDAGGRLALYSSELGARVHPRITCAYNPLLVNDTVLRILRAVESHEDTLSRLWSWGRAALSPRTPRLSWNDLVIAPAAWRLRLTADERRRLADGDGDGDGDGMESSDLVESLVTRHDLPHLVTAGTSDRKMVYDLEVPLCRRLLADALRRRGELRVEEVLIPRDEHVSELVVPFVTTGSEETDELHSPSASIRPVATPTEQRHRLARRWLYLEIYAQPGDLTDLALECARCIRYLREKDLIRRWFFVRYNDPAHHLRCRVETGEDDSRGQALAHLHHMAEDQIRDGRVSELRVVPYHPEWDRYGGTVGIDLAHELFWLDSEAFTHLAPLVDPHPPDPTRHLVTCLTIDRMLQALGLSWSARHGFVASVCQSLGKEFPGSEPILGKQFRRCRPLLVPLLAGESTHAEHLVEIGLLTRLTALEAGPTLRRYRDRMSELPDAEARWRRALWSLFHMHVNRAFPSDWRWHELQVMHLLRLAYQNLRHTREPIGT